MIVFALFLSSQSWNYDRRVTFFLTVGKPKMAEEKGKRLNENNEPVKLESGTRHHWDGNTTLQLLESMYHLNNRLEQLQWERKQISSQDLLRMEATLSKSHNIFFIWIDKVNYFNIKNRICCFVSIYSRYGGHKKLFVSGCNDFCFNCTSVCYS